MLRKIGIHLLVIPFRWGLLLHNALPKPPVPDPVTPIETGKKRTLVGIYFYLWFGNMDGTPGTRH